MQNSFLTTIRSLKIVDGCKAVQVYALNPYGCEKSLPEQARTTPPRPPLCNPAVSDSLLPYGLPSPDLIEPSIDPHLKAVDFVDTLASIHRLLRDAPPAARVGIYLYQYSVFRDLADPKLLRRSLRATRQHAVSAHDKLVTAAWLRFERREDELEGAMASKCAGRMLECPVAALLPGYDPESVYDPCPCRRPPADASDADACNDDEHDDNVVEDAQIDDDDNVVEDAQIDDDDNVVEEDVQMEECSTSADEGDVAFCIGDKEVVCIRSSIAALSKPLKAMLYGCFREAWKEKINFSHNGISVNGMRGVDGFSRTGCLDSFPIETLLELLSFANVFCCEELKSACDRRLASFVDCIDDAVILVEYGLEETAHSLVGACLQVFLRELPRSFNLPEVSKLLCSEEGRERLALVGHASFLLYYFLSQVAMEEDLRSNRTVMLLERLEESADEGWQKQLAAHQLGCVLLEREEYKDAQHWFEAAANAGHVYSMAGVARAKHKRGHKYSAYKLANSLISEHKPSGWMLQERSLYCIGKERMVDLYAATKMDPTLTFPYKYRAVMMSEESKIGAAISEMNKILGFKVTTDCLELRAWFSLATEEYEAALRDIRALLTLDPDYMMFHGKLRGEQLMEMLCQKLQPWGAVDCWMQLHDRWSCVDDIGSLAVVHQMLQLKDTAMTPSTLRFRQSLLLLRWSGNRSKIEPDLLLEGVGIICKLHVAIENNLQILGTLKTGGIGISCKLHFAFENNLQILWTLTQCFLQFCCADTCGRFDPSGHVVKFQWRI
ncbi:hypothetical protein ACLOJK_023411 [Asimina triloba]